MSTKNDEMVLQLLAKIKSKKAEIASIERPSYKTSCTVGTDLNRSDRINLQVVTDINVLVDLYAFLTAKEEAEKLAAKELGVNVSTSWMGYSFKLWKEDIKARVSYLGVAAKKKELDLLEKRVDSLVTVEQRREMELAAITKELEGS